MKIWIAILLFALPAVAQDSALIVGSKTFPESYILAEIAAQTIEDVGEARVTRKFGFGATGIVFEAITHGSIDVYPEYSGTISEAFLKDPSITQISEIRARLASRGIDITDSLGFDNTYALGVRAEFARQNHLKTISDLAAVGNAKLGFTHEFMNRADGYPGLAKRYGFRFPSVKALQHQLAYDAIMRGEIDVTDVYSTDADIQRLGLVVLKDDLGFFPAYQGVYLARREWINRFPKTWAALKKLEHSISPDKMIELNAMVEIKKKSFSETAAFFLHKTNAKPRGNATELLQRTEEHLELVLVSLLSAILVGLPLGILAYYRQSFGKLILIFAGLVQTVPSMALLALLIPVFGIGLIPALVALFLYGLLPVVVNTFTGLETIEPRILESAQGLGLSRGRILWEVLLPIASPNILAGVRTSAVIGIGTATLAAFIGAGGYGAPIITGLALNDVNIILQGAIPAALMAIVAQIGLDYLARVLIPKGLQK